MSHEVRSGKTIKTNIHHRHPKSKKGDKKTVGGRPNMIRIPVKLHNAWHTIAVNYEPPEIARIINRYLLDPDWYFVAKKRKPL